MGTDFTPLTGALGGLLIGVASIGLLLATGRIAGISGIVAGIFLPIAGDVRWRVAFVAGLPLGAWVVARVAPTTAVLDMTSSKWLLVVAGLLVGLGTQIGNGCTSGHGICGLARGSARSLVATITFIATAAITVYVSRHLLRVG
jgi:uncharacterized membrane protein YedE/YeeE